MVTIPEHCHASSARLILVDHPLALEQLHPTATEGPPLRSLLYWTDCYFEGAPVRPSYHSTDGELYVTSVQADGLDSFVTIAVITVAWSFARLRFMIVAV